VAAVPHLRRGGISSALLRVMAGEARQNAAGRDRTRRVHLGVMLGDDRDIDVFAPRDLLPFRIPAAQRRPLP
jgi:hypothetical protein